MKKEVRELEQQEEWEMRILLYIQDLIGLILMMRKENLK